MIGNATITVLIAKYGIAILLPLAIIGGPPVVIGAAYMARLSLLNLNEVIACVIAADIVGDSLYYGLGRTALDRLPIRFRERIGASPARIEQVSQTFLKNGARVLVISKLTQFGGFAILMGAGAAHMPFWRFLLINVLVTIPKSLALVAIGYYFGGAHELISRWFSVASGIFVFILGLILVGFIYKKRRAIS